MRKGTRAAKKRAPDVHSWWAAAAGPQPGLETGDPVCFRGLPRFPVFSSVHLASQEGGSVPSPGLPRDPLFLFPCPSPALASLSFFQTLVTASLSLLSSPHSPSLCPTVSVSLSVPLSLCLCLSPTHPCRGDSLCLEGFSPLPAPRFLHTVSSSSFTFKCLPLWESSLTSPDRGKCHLLGPRGAAHSRASPLQAVGPRVSALSLSGFSTGSGLKQAPRAC